MESSKRRLVLLSMIFILKYFINAMGNKWLVLTMLTGSLSSRGLDTKDDNRHGKMNLFYSPLKEQLV